ncbi:MAG TPA: hypothetical protein DHV15_05110 [Treponema sp.]|uniref:Uncharacterized protein n=1 Tax=Treponema denticola (strain ATCC 35405 / DSM 14222 / CIP 103919 / JCM 8153 / KCTC 15104) TaxID=243275 RepID=Q73KW8_TREDE|nr:hypothetical protein TDE_2099 [Treponema denticola ATCC 35405]HCY94879.1 hypothetical protein [Treponema sp.]
MLHIKLHDKLFKRENFFPFHNYCMKSLQQIVKILKKIKFY